MRSAQLEENAERERAEEDLGDLGVNLAGKVLALEVRLLV